MEIVEIVGRKAVEIAEIEVAETEFEVVVEIDEIVGRKAAEIDVVVEIVEIVERKV